MSKRQQRVVVEREGGWTWVRYAGNNAPVATSPDEWMPHERSNCVRAARSEARLTGARLIIDGEEVQP